MNALRSPYSLKSSFLLWLCLLALFCVVPAHAQSVTGTLATILDEEPSGSGWNAVVADATAQSQNNGHPLYHSTLLENQTFEGDYTPTRRMALTIFSDDGSDVTVDGTLIWNGKGKGQTLEILSESLHKLSVTLEANTTHHIKVDYSNIVYTGSGDIDGCTLFAYEKIAPYISLDTAQSPMTATYSSPNGIDPSNVKFIFDGVDQTSNTTHDGSSLSYTLPDSVSFFASHAVRVEVTDNDSNLGVAAVSAHVFLPVTPFQDTSTTTQVSYNLLGPEQVRVRVCPWQTDTTVRTFTASQGPGEASVTWDGLDDSGNRVDSDVYIFKVEEQVGTSWVDVADIDPITGKAARLNIDGARLSDENINVVDTNGNPVKNRTTALPTIRWKLPSGSWNMVPLVQTGQTLLGVPVDGGPANSTLDGFAYNYPIGSRNQNAPKPNVLQGTSTTYWQIQDVLRVRSLVNQYKLPSPSAGYHVVNGLPVVDVTTGIPGAVVTQLSPGTMAYRGAGNGTKLMAYTFDDGPYNNASAATQNTGSGVDQAITQELLDKLSPYGYHATFCTNGTRIRATNDANTDTLWNMVSAGHELADHTYDHTPDLNTYYADKIRSEVIEDRLMERWVIGVKHNSTNGQPSMPYYRPPGGGGVGYTNRSIIDANYNFDPNHPEKPAHYNDANFWNTVGETGYMVIAWGPSPSDPGETPGITVSEQANNIRDYLKAANHIQPGYIVLLHNGREHTVIALGMVLPYLQGLGYTIGRVSDVNPVAADSNINDPNP